MSEDVTAVSMQVSEKAAEAAERKAAAAAEEAGE